ncbi:MAG: HIRAN domain-containing protein [Proteobacteria bacterium]|nr:HIRAN domain-containing protein [Pseudomonadota bacterium]
MKILLLIAVIALAAFIIYAVIGYAQRDDEEPEEPVNPPRQLSDAEREAIRQAEDVFDFETRIAILQGTYTGPLPEHIAGGHWTELYPDIFHTKIAGINYRKGLGNLAGLFFDARIEPEPKNKYDKNAIKIIKADDGLHLGYIPADETSYVRQFINNDFNSHCEAFIEEGEDWDYDTEREKRFLYGYINIHRPSSDNSTSVSPTA